MGKSFLVMLFLAFLITGMLSLLTIVSVYAQQVHSEENVTERIEAEKEFSLRDRSDRARLLVLSNTEWGGMIRDSVSDEYIIGSAGNETITFVCGRDGTFNATLQKFTEGGDLRFLVIQNGKDIDFQQTTEPFGIVTVSSKCYFPDESTGGCLIATATFGTELAPQIQELRELRDNTLLETEYGTSFMNGFNQFYYSFSPTISDWERQNQFFKEAVKFTITPMISSLSILNHADIDSEEEMLGYGIGVILLNIGMYFVAPGIVIIGLKNIFKRINQRINC